MNQQDSPPADLLLPHFEVVWMTSAQTGLPHCREFTAANPNIIQHRCASPDASGGERAQIWRNCDRHLRNCQKANSHMVKSQPVISLEWDVVCKVPLDRIFSAQEGLVGSRIKEQEVPNDSWY